MGSLSSRCSPADRQRGVIVRCRRRGISGYGYASKGTRVWWIWRSADGLSGNGCVHLARPLVGGLKRW
nr:MAG TPA: hypothetical protein [Caudoviricetes sp.]